MEFAHPKMLYLAAVALPVLVWFLVACWRKKQKLMGQFVQSRLLAQLTVGVSAARQKARLVLLALAVAFLFLALAGPRFGFVWEEVRQRGLDIVVAIDTSRSMLASDVAPNRLTRAKLAAMDLIRLARNDRLGLVAFAGTAFLQCPLTLDDEAFRQSVNALDVGIIPEGGTAIAEAIESALDAFKDSDINHKVLLLFTDGEDNDGRALEAAGKAEKAGMHIFTIGVGTPQGERIRVTDDHGATSYVKDEQGKDVVSHLNATLLTQIAKATTGDFLELRGAKTMDNLYEARLGPLPRSEASSRLFQQFKERFQWPLGLAIALLFLEPFLPDRRRIRRTDEIVTASNPGLRKMVAASIAFLALLPAQSSPAKALREYEQGQFSAAEKEYQRLLKDHPDDPRLHYNAGTAAYRAGEFGKATNDLNAAVLSSDPELLKRAYYNLGNSLYRIGEKEADPSAMSANWQQSLASFDSALKLDPKDPDAKFNRDLVAKRLEELKQQQSKNQQGKDDKDKQDKDKQKKDQNQDQQKQDKSKQDQQKEAEKDKDKEQQAKQQQADQDKEKKPDQQQAQSQPDKDEKGQSAADQKKQEDQKIEPRTAENSGEQQPDEEEKANQAAMALGQMSPQQARQLLDASRSEERPMVFRNPQDAKTRVRSLKDW